MVFRCDLLFQLAIHSRNLYPGVCYRSCLRKFSLPWLCILLFHRLSEYQCILFWSWALLPVPLMRVAPAQLPEKGIPMKENHIKAIFTAIFALISSILGVLTVPVLLMVACNVLDYVTGLMASTYRSEDINSYKSIRGIMKKVSMWLLVIVGAIIDQLLLYASQTAGISLPFTFLVACIVAIWIICNEIISILENIKDMGVTIPAFLIPLVTHVKSQVEDKVSIDDTEKEDSEGE